MDLRSVAFSRGQDMRGLIRRSRRLSPAIVFLLGYSTASLAQQAHADLQAVDRFSGHPRAIILSDIGNEPDDQKSLVRLLVYSSELDIEALIASTSIWQRNTSHPETLHALNEAYGQVRSNLMVHAKDWPTREDLDSRVFAGQPANGLEATGHGESSAGSRAQRRQSPAVGLRIWRRQHAGPSLDGFARHQLGGRDSQGGCPTARLRQIPASLRIARRLRKMCPAIYRLAREGTTRRSPDPLPSQGQRVIGFPKTCARSPLKSTTIWPLFRAGLLKHEERSQVPRRLGSKTRGSAL